MAVLPEETPSLIPRGMVAARNGRSPAPTALNAYLQHALGWSRVRLVIRITCNAPRPTAPRGERQTSRETVYGITSLPRDQAHAARLRELHRHRWTIENRVFYVR